MSTEPGQDIPEASGNAPTAATVATGSGPLVGITEGGVSRFLGIPYAAAPFGEHRFRLPQPVEPWEEPRDASRLGATAPQAPYSGPIGELLATVTVPGNEILNVNVWTPADHAGASLPVMVWIHGGSFVHGSNALDAYDGTAFARDGVVLVAVNYRLGSEGFSVLDDVPMNLGIADQLAALVWVQDEIAHFGGDPSNVTVFGESAGGSSVATLLAHPDAASLMTRAIVQSGPLESQTRERAGRVSKLMAKDLGVPASRAGFKRIPPEGLVASQERVMAGGNPISGGPGFAVATDTQIVPASPFDALRAGQASGIPLLIGSTTEEYRLWFVPTGLIPTFKRFHLFAARLKLGIRASTVRTFRRNRPKAPTGEILGAIATDLLLRVPLNRVADARAAAGSDTWVYEFAWRSPVGEDGHGALGAAHALELGFVFDHLDSPEAIRMTGTDAPQSLATSMHDAWVSFATTGDPGWARWDATRPVRTFDGVDDAVVLAPRDDERQALTP
ncbi:carboxylesterase family protein [Plantibacter flavus]|uniref:carboxylesterase/lipase family protein n=1 Tax=Plantibacter flavus TaxID=150123 RepID=UPI003F151304